MLPTGPMLNRIYNWLVSADPSAKADVIFVLAGLQNRKIHALKLFQQGLASCVLLSVGRFEIRRFVDLGLPQKIDLLKMAQSISPPERHFFVLFTGKEFEVQRMRVGALGTLTEIEALAEWLKAHPEISTLLVVSSGSHLRRLKICCGMLLPADLKIRLLAAPDENSGANIEDLWKDRRARKSMVTELFKIACYGAFLPVWRIARHWRRKTILSLPL